MSEKKRRKPSDEFSAEAPVTAPPGPAATGRDVGLGAVIDALPNAVVLLDGATEQVLHWNQEAEALFGLPGSEAIGKPFRRLMPEPLRGSLQAHERTMGTIHPPAGRARVVEMTARPIADRAGRGYLLVHLLDVTARSRVAAQVEGLTQFKGHGSPFAPDVRQAAAHTRLMEILLTRLPTGVFYVGTDLILRFANPHYGRLIGVPPEEIVGLHFFDLFPETEAATTRFLEEIQQLQPGLSSYNAKAVPWEVQGPQGVSTTYWDFSIAPVENEHGETEGYVVMTDEVSDRVRLEQDLTRHMDLLNEAQRLAHVGSWELELPSRRTICSEEFLRIFGLASEDSLLTLEGYFQHVHPDEREESARVIEEAIETRLPFSADRRIIRTDGAERQIRMWGSPVFDPGGKLVKLVGAVQDVTDQHEVQRMKEDFLAIVSHELRTPLAALKGAISILQAGRHSPEDQGGRSMLALAGRNIGRMERLVNDILDMQRLVTRRLPIRPEAVSAEQLFQDATEMFADRARDGGIALQAAATSTAVWADPQRAIQVLANLLDNALSFSPRGTTIELSAEPAGDDVLFRIEDRGPGIPPERLEDVFAPFRQVEGPTTRRRGGTGLGLALCRGIIEQHGGRIWAENRPDGGARLSFTLPRTTDLS